ncbi:MAG TPA: type II CAAX endopeptidase family protein [Gammaproteobacteria bacterium]|nr:type II CAAX endopeptidase family protein [Gammaproteobacteria bacterium]
MNIERRSGKLWAVLQFPLTRMAIGFLAIVLFAFSILAGASALHLHGLAYATMHLLSGLVAWGVYLVYVRVLEHRTAAELELPHSMPRFAKGFGIGLVLYCVTIGILWLSGTYQVAWLNPNQAVLAVFINALGAALLEEIAIRGVVFRIMEGSLGTWLALAISALFFGLLHAINPGANWQSVLGIALQGGLILAAAYVYTRNLWLAIGLHCAWNFASGGIFGSDPKSRSLLAAHLQGPEWLTGGPDGLDASVVATLICLAATVGFLLLARRHGHIITPYWRRNRSPG